MQTYEMQIRLRQGAMHTYCRANNISRDELSRRMHVASSTAYRIERGDVAPSPKFIAALMRTTGQSFEELFEIDEAVPA